MAIMIGTLFVTNPPARFTPIISILIRGCRLNIKVFKDIGLAFNGEVPGTISIVDQNFSQTYVPEPASLMFLRFRAYRARLGW